MPILSDKLFGSIISQIHRPAKLTLDPGLSEKIDKYFLSNAVFHQYAIKKSTSKSRPNRIPLHKPACWRAL